MRPGPWRGSDRLDRAAVAADHRAVDVACPRADQEGGGGGEFFHRAVATHRDLRPRGIGDLCRRGSCRSEPLWPSYCVADVDGSFEPSVSSLIGRARAWLFEVIAHRRQSRLGHRFRPAGPAFARSALESARIGIGWITPEEAMSAPGPSPRPHAAGTAGDTITAHTYAFSSWLWSDREVGLGCTWPAGGPPGC